MVSVAAAGNELFPVDSGHAEPSGAVELFIAADFLGVKNLSPVVFTAESSKVKSMFTNSHFRAGNGQKGERAEEDEDEDREEDECCDICRVR